MIGTTLNDIRTRIEELASDTGEYALVCARYGDPPVPATGLRFETRASARAAARATEQYRAALRRYDPRLPYHDVVVRQETGPLSQPGETTGVGTADTADSRLPTAGVGGTPSDRDGLVEFCHRIAAAVFETLSEREYDAVESAVMDAYFEHAETLGDPDDLCLCLVESMAQELDEELPPAEQATVVADAASRLPDDDSAEQPISATLGLLEARGLLGGYTRTPSAIAPDDDRRLVDVRISGYALSPQRGRLPVLPLALDLYRRRPDWRPDALRATRVDDDWQLTLALAADADPTGLASAPIRSEV
jgi:hypothetical protein